MRATRWRLLRVTAVAVAVAGLVAIFLQVRTTAGRTDANRFDERLDAVLASLPDDRAGCAAAVYENDGLEWSGARGLAVLPGRRPITDATVFGLGNTTAQFTATAALVLAARGRLDLNAPVRRYLRGLPSWASAVSVGDLLRNTSGISDARELFDAEPDRPVTSRALLARVQRLRRLEYLPGGHHGRSRTDYVLLGLVIETVAGRSLRTFLASDVLAPAGLSSAVLDRHPSGSDVADSYETPGGTPYPPTSWETLGDVGLSSTAKDLATWGAQYWHSTVGGSRADAESVAKLRADALGGAGPWTKASANHVAWGPGVWTWTDRAGRLLVRAPGVDPDGWGIAAFQSDLVVIPEQRLAAAVLCNHVQPDPRLSGDLALRLLGVVRGEPVPQPHQDW